MADQYGPLPNTTPEVTADMPPVIEVDWPPATPQGPSDPADTPGWEDNDDLFPATEAEGGD